MKLPDIIEVTLKVVKVFEKLDIAYHIGGSLATSVRTICSVMRPYSSTVFSSK